MPTVLPLAVNSHLPVWPDTASALYAGTVLVVTPLLAAIGGIPTLTKLGHWAALLFGAAMVTYGTVGIAGARLQAKLLGRGRSEGAAAGQFVALDSASSLRTMSNRP